LPLDTSGMRRIKNVGMKADVAGKNACSTKS
jgi:hypothetical protein